MSSDINFDRIENIARHSGKNDKINLLIEYLAIPSFKRTVIAAQDPFVTYGIKKVLTCDKITFTNEAGKFTSETWGILDLLASRNLTGDAAKEAVHNEMARLNYKSAELFRRIVTKNLKAGFSPSSVNRAKPGTIFVFKCMLAKSFDVNRIKIWPVAVEPKYDGVRALAIYNAEENQTRLFSRSGKEFFNFDEVCRTISRIVYNAPHFADGEDVVFDGEIMSGDFNVTVGDIHKKGVQSNESVFMTFDIMTRYEFEKPGDVIQPYIVRRGILSDILAFYDEEIVPLLTDIDFVSVKLPPMRLALNLEEIMDFYEEVRSSGGEGVIVKIPEAPYQKKRSMGWMKIKDCKSTDSMIVGFDEGQNRLEGNLGAIVIDFNGVEVFVGSGLNDDWRKEIWNDQAFYLGQIAEVEYHEVTPDGSLRHPRFISIRTDKPEEDGEGN